MGTEPMLWMSPISSLLAARWPMQRTVMVRSDLTLANGILSLGSTPYRTEFPRNCQEPREPSAACQTPKSW